MSDNKDRVIALMQDLMFMVRLQETANSAGLETVVVKTRADAMTKAAEQPLLFVIDLNYEAGEPLELIRALKSSTASRNIHLLAFVSHVQVHLRAAATVRLRHGSGALGVRAEVAGSYHKPAYFALATQVIPSVPFPASIRLTVQWERSIAATWLAESHET